MKLLGKPIQRIEIYLVDSVVCLLHDRDHIDNDDQVMVSEIKHSVSNPLRELNNYDKAMYIISSIHCFLNFDRNKQARKF